MFELGEINRPEQRKFKLLGGGIEEISDASFDASFVRVALLGRSEFGLYHSGDIGAKFYSVTLKFR